MAGLIATLVLLAALVTMTTRTTDMVDAVVGLCRPLRRVGVDPERVGLMLALGIRSVPVVVGLAEEVRDAQRARAHRQPPCLRGAADRPLAPARRCARRRPRRARRRRLTR